MAHRAVACTAPNTKNICSLRPRLEFSPLLDEFLTMNRGCFNPGDWVQILPGDRDTFSRTVSAIIPLFSRRFYAIPARIHILSFALEFSFLLFFEGLKKVDISFSVAGKKKALERACLFSSRSSVLWILHLYTSLLFS